MCEETIIEAANGVESSAKSHFEQFCMVSATELAIDR